MNDTPCIPHLPDVCRVCLIHVSEEESVLLSKDCNSIDPYERTLNLLCPSLVSNDELESSYIWPHRICLACSKTLSEIYVFQKEVQANARLLHGSMMYTFASNPQPLEDLLATEDDITTTVKSTLHRLKIIDKHPFNKLLSPGEDNDYLVFKFELVDSSVPEPDAVEQEHSHTVEGQDDEYDSSSGAGLESELQPVQSQRFTSKKTRCVAPIETEDGLRTRVCYIKECVPVQVGQAEKHARKYHRAYCQICGLVFPTHAQTAYHIAIHKSAANKLICELCDKPFWRELDLKIHRREFHGKETANLECPFCDELFERRKILLQHRESHTSCKYCLKQFKSYRFMVEHIRAHHSSSMLSCDLCCARFLGRREYQTHMEKHRDGVMDNSIQFSNINWVGASCVTCDRLYYSEKYLSEHILNDHKNGISEKPKKVMVYKKRTQEELDLLEFKYKCSDCDAHFRLKTSLKGHWKKNHSGEQFICEHCGARFKCKAQMKLHERYIHTKDFRFTCEFCDKRCHTTGDMAIHRRSHTNEKPYKCTHEGCGKAYKTRSALTKHIRAHTGEKPYKCSYEGCDKAYACSQLLKVHIRNHTLEKPFKCWYCELFFNSTNNRRKHCRRHHAGMPIGRELEGILKKEVSSKVE